MRFAAVWCQRVQYFGFDRSADVATEIEFHLKVRPRVLVTRMMNEKCARSPQFSLTHP